MRDPKLDAYLAQHLSGLGVRKDEAPAVAAPTAGQGGRFVNPQGPIPPSIPLQLGGLFGSSNTTKVDPSMNPQVAALIALITGQNRPNQPPPAPPGAPGSDWVQFEDGSWGPPY